VDQPREVKDDVSNKRGKKNHEVNNKPDALAVDISGNVEET